MAEPPDTRITTSPAPAGSPSFRKQQGHPWWTAFVALAYLIILCLFCICTPGMILLPMNLAVFAHCLAHLFLALALGVPVRTVSLGFGPPFPGAWFRRGETMCKVSLVPIGGYVSYADEQGIAIWRRLILHGGGVLASAALALLGFMLVGYHGDEQITGVVGRVEPGSPSWVIGVRSGDVIRHIGDTEQPSYGDLLREVMLSRGPLPITFGPPDGQLTETTIEPRRSETSARPVIGVSLPLSLVLPPPTRRSSDDIPVDRNSAASRAQPPFQFGDHIIGTTDPDQPDRVTPLPANQHNPQSSERDYFEFRKRLQRLAGKEMTIQVHRQTGDVDIKVPPAFHWTLGLRMTMGPVVAVRQLPGEPANPVHFKGQQIGARPVKGDRIYAVEVPLPEGGRRRWVQRDPAPAVFDVRDQHLDPVRLPFELNEWARRRRREGDKVTLTLLRAKDHELDRVTVELAWDDRFLYSNEAGMSTESVMAVGGLGIAYQVETMVENVLPGAPATRGTTLAGQLFPLQPGDHITAFRTYNCVADGEPTQPQRYITLEPGGWTCADQWMQIAEAKRLDLKVERGGHEYEVTLNAEEDRSWPETERGLALMSDTQVQRAHDPLAAILLGGRRLYRSTSTILESIVAMYQRRVGSQYFAGPVRIVQSAPAMEYILYLYLSLFAGANALVALANLLPIPGCDGWSLLCALFRRRPAEKCP